MNTSLSQRLTTTRLRRACAQVPLWILGISGAEGDGGDGGTGNGTGNSNEPTAREKALEEEKNRHYESSKKAKEELAEQKKTLDETLARLKEIEDKDKSEVDKATAAAATALKQKEEAEARIADLTKTQEDYEVKLAFLGNAKYTWHNPATALKLLDRTGVEIKDGEVKGLDKAIDKLAKDEAYLVKTGGTGGKQGEQGGGQGQQNNGTGAVGNGQSTRNTDTSKMTEAQKTSYLDQKFKIPR